MDNVDESPECQIIPDTGYKAIGLAPAILTIIPLGYSG